MEAFDTREWLLTNGLGSFACGTISDAHTRTYHGWLFAAIDPPSQRTLLLSHVEASLYIAGQAIDLGTNIWGSGDIHPKGYQLLRSFTPDPIPTWVWSHLDWEMSRRILMPFGLTSHASVDDICAKGPQSSPHPPPQISNRVLIHYTYRGQHSAILTLRPLVGDRSFHHQQHMDANLQFSQLVNSQCVFLQAIRQNWAGIPWHLCWSRGDYYPDGVWYWDFQYPEETRRGLGDREDLYSPGYLVVYLEPGMSVTLEAQVGWPEQPEVSLTDQTFSHRLQVELHRLRQQYSHLHLNLADKDTDKLTGAETEKHPTLPTPTDDSNNIGWVGDRPIETMSYDQIKHQLLLAGEKFIAYRQSVTGPTVIAGYPWFGDWGRDTLISIPGLALSTQRYDLARGLLQTFAAHCKYGLIPNAFPDTGTQPFYNCLDASLWWIETLGLYLEATQDWDMLIQHYPTVQRIYKALTAGTLHNIRVDAVDGLLTWNSPGVALTWMDAVIDEQPVTPRRGKAVEINALWYSSLCWAKQWAEWLCQNTDDCSDLLINQARRYERQAEQVKESLKKFWNPQRGYFFDVIRPDDRPDASIRPNGVIALSLAHCGFSVTHGTTALQVAHDRLLTPYGLRSLDPADPAYIGQYGGDVYHRDRAYHQGTVWSWLIGPFIRAWTRFYPDRPVPFDGRYLLNHFKTKGCVDSISEMFDGDAPHRPQGAIAQAWSVAEIIRHFSDFQGFERE